MALQISFLSNAYLLITLAVQFLVVSAAPLSDYDVTSKPVTAMVALIGVRDNVDGIVIMTQASPDDDVEIRGTVTNLPAGKHGFHISATGDLTNGCYVAGDHYNPFNATMHGAPSDLIRHVGDLGNIVGNENGVAKFIFTDSVVSLYPTTPAFIIGRVLVVHETFDDLRRGGMPNSLVNGNAGGRLACGVIAYK